jgi:predicted transcriptional regulator
MSRFTREPMTLFAQCGMSLYGDLFVSRLADALGVAERTVQRWSSGAREVPPDIWGKLVKLLYDERVRLDETAVEALEHQQDMLDARAQRDRQRREEQTA